MSMSPHTTGSWSPAIVAVWYTPRDVARQRGIKTSKVMGWIRTGELEAVNHASNLRGRPRWRISGQALYTFDQARSNRANVTPQRVKRRRGIDVNAVKEFF